MAIFYLDYINGNDANDGSSWALAWKTITNGATAARIAPGDTIRIAKSLDPTSLGITATWTDLSKTVTLASALTLNVDLCETAWTASTNVTATASSTGRKEGSYCASLAIAAGFTTGKVAYKALAGVTDFSSYQQLSFWVQNNAAISADNVLRVCLCSDTAGDTIVDSFYIPAIPSTGRWMPVTVNKGTALGTSIQSVSLWADSDPGTITVLLDNIIACKASSSADSLSLTSLIGKNTGTEGWFGIQSINGTIVLLDNETATSAIAGRGYSGTTESVTTYKRETIKTAIAATQAAYVQECMEGGTSDSVRIIYSGGWNTATTAQDGQTFFDGSNGWGEGLYVYNKNFISTERLNFSRYYDGIYVSNAGSEASNNFNAQNISNNTLNGFVFYNGTYFASVTIENLNNNGHSGARGLYGKIGRRTYTIINANSNINVGLNVATGQYDNGTVTNTNNNGLHGAWLDYGADFTITNAKDNVQYGIYFGSFSATVRNVTTSGNGSRGVYYIDTDNCLINCTINEASETNTIGGFSNPRLYSHDHDGVAGNHQIFTDYGLITGESSVRHTASGLAWKLSPTSSLTRVSYFPLDFKIAKIAVAANGLVTVKAWLRRTNTGLTGMLACRGGQIAGVSSDVTATMTAAIDTWEELTITFTPTENGIVEIEVWAYGGSAYSLYVDDLTITQA